MYKLNGAPPPLKLTHNVIRSQIILVLYHLTCLLFAYFTLQDSCIAPCRVALEGRGLGCTLTSILTSPESTGTMKLIQLSGGKERDDILCTLCVI